MNIVNKLTLRHIKSHKRRSLLTLLSIIVSVAMVTAVFTSVFSFLKFFQDSTEAYDGNWHAQFMYETMPDMTAFEKGDFTYYSGANAFQCTYDKNSKETKATAQIDAVDEAVVRIRNIHIIDGSFPKKINEILLTKEYIEKNKLDWKVGDKVRLYCLDYNTEKEEYRDYTLCGIAEGNVSFFDHCGGIVAKADGAIPDGAPVYVNVSYNKLDKSIYDKSEALKKNTGAGKISYNEDLLSFSGVAESESLKAIGTMAAIILMVIVIASVIMIYDSFSVSYQERERYLGMLASVGATKRQKRSSIYFEGLILGGVAVPVGIAAGVIGMEITFRAIQDALLNTVAIPIKDTLKVHFNPYILLGTVLITALTIFISCYIPARRASKTTPIAAIKGTNTVKVKKAKRLRVSKFTRKLYGFEGELAVKNFKRNGRRSRSIIFALVMSVVLFVSVTNFSQMFTVAVQQEAGEETADFSIYTAIKDKDSVKDYLDTADIDEYVLSITRYGTLKNTELFTDDSVKAFNLETSKDKKDLFLYVMSNESFDEYLKAIGESPEAYHGADIPKAILYNCVADSSGSAAKAEEHKAFQNHTAGKKLNCYVQDYNEKTGKFDIQRDFSVTAGVLTDEAYDGRLFMPKYMDAPAVILPEDAVAYLPFEHDGYTFSVFARDYKAAAEAADEYFDSKGISCEVVDSTSQMQAVNSLLEIVKVFIYGFITLITLIAIINIINSISNSMNERKTEFAMLKSVGVTPKGFKKMIYVESLRYGIKSLLWSVPLSVGLHALMYYALSNAEGMQIPFSTNWQNYLAAVLAVFVIILMSLLYSADKIKDDNIIENLKQD